MNPAQAVAALRDRIRQYVEGHLSLRDLHLWIAAQEAALQGTVDAWDELSGEYWALVAELQAGERDEVDFRTALAAAGSVHAEGELAPQLAPHLAPRLA